MREAVDYNLADRFQGDLGLLDALETDDFRMKMDVARDILQGFLDTFQDIPFETAVVDEGKPLVGREDGQFDRQGLVVPKQIEPRVVEEPVFHESKARQTILDVSIAIIQSIGIIGFLDIGDELVLVHAGFPIGGQLGFPTAIGGIPARKGLF